MFKINKILSFYSAVHQVLLRLASGYPLANSEIQHQFLLENTLLEHLYTVGAETDVTIAQLAETIQKNSRHTGEIVWDSAKPDGTPRKFLDVSKMNSLGWKAEIELVKGIKSTYQWFLDNQNNY